MEKEQLRADIEYGEKYIDPGSRYDGLLQAARAHLASLDSGYVMVPRKCTHEMEKAALESYVPPPDNPTVPMCDIIDAQPNLQLRIIRTIYNAMIAAAPTVEKEG